MTIAQIVWDNEKHFGLTDEDIHDKASAGIVDNLNWGSSMNM